MVVLVDLNSEIYWSRSGAPFEGGDTRPIDAAVVSDDSVIIFRDTKTYMYSSAGLRGYDWQTPTELTAPAARWAEQNAPFEFSTRPIDDAFIIGTYFVAQRDRMAYLWLGGNWLTPIRLDSPISWSQPNAPFFYQFVPERLAIFVAPPSAAIPNRS